MIGILGSVMNMTRPSPLTVKRDYEVFLRGPAEAITQRLGSVERRRYGEWFAPALTVLAEPSDSFTGAFGIVESGSVTVQIAMPAPDGPVLLLEDGGSLLLEDGSSLSLE